MSGDNYSDYYQYTWTKISPRTSLLKFIKNRSLIYGSLLCLIMYGIMFASQSQKIVIPAELFWSLSIIASGILFLVGCIDFQVSKNLPLEVKRYHINEGGLKINQKTYPFSSFKKFTSLPSTTPNIRNGNCLIILRKPYGSLKIEYNHSKEAEKIIQALNHYQSKT